MIDFRTLEMWALGAGPPPLVRHDDFARRRTDVAPSLSVAGTPLNWEQAIRTAVEKQPLIKMAEHEALESQALVKQIESANYPQVTGIVSSTAGNTRVLANLGISGSLPKPTNYMTTPGIRADYLITDFGRTAHRILSQKSLAAVRRNGRVDFQSARHLERGAGLSQLPEAATARGHLSKRLG